MSQMSRSSSRGRSQEWVLKKKPRYGSSQLRVSQGNTQRMGVESNLKVSKQTFRRPYDPMYKRVMAIVNSKVETKDFSGQLVANTGSTPAFPLAGNVVAINLTSGIVQGTSEHQRIGDVINIKGIRLQGLVALGLTVGDLHMFVGVVRCLEGITPTYTTFYRNVGGTALLDRLDTRQVDIVWYKSFRLKSYNTAGNSVVMELKGYADRKMERFPYRSDAGTAGKYWDYYLFVTSDLGAIGSFLPQAVIQYTVYYKDA